MAGSCTAIVRKANTSKIINIPYRYWGLKINEVYRVVILSDQHLSGCPPYSFDAKLFKSGQSARITLPICLTKINVGDIVNVWVGCPEDFGQPGEMYGRGYCQRERAKILEE